MAVAIVKKWLSPILVGVASLPIAVVLTFLSSPFWGWFEAKFGIESLGHSGPADWCFVAVYLAVLTLALAVWLLRR